MGKREYEVVFYEPLSKPSDPRYIVVDTETGEVLDNAQGYGYKTKQKAHIAYSYKTRDKKKDKSKKQTRHTVQEWCKQHSEFVEDLIETRFIIAKGAAGPDDVFDAAYVERCFETSGYTNLPFTASEFLRYW